MSEEIILGTPRTSVSGTDKELKKYHCNYCDTKFKHYVLKVEKFNERGEGSCASTQVKCPGCGNFLKTWE